MGLRRENVPEAEGVGLSEETGSRWGLKPEISGIGPMLRESVRKIRWEGSIRGGHLSFGRPESSRMKCFFLH